jgi:tetratricopeptide (TPR) repeat protein
MPRIVVIVWALLCAMAMSPAVAAASALVIDPLKQWHYAGQLFENGRFRQSAEEFERFAFFFPEHPRQRQAVFEAGRAYLLARDGASALQNFNALIQYGLTDEVAVDAYFMMAETHMRLGNPGQAILQLNNLMALSDDPGIVDRARLRIGWIYIEQLDWGRSRGAWEQMTPEGRRTYGIDALETALDQTDQLPRKRPVLAGALSVVPGAGQLYIGRYQDALAALIVNGGLAWAAYDSFDNDLNGLGGLLTMVGLGFYTANIYGAVSGAHKFNRDRQREFVEQLKQNGSAGTGPADSAPFANALLLKWRILF